MAGSSAFLPIPLRIARVVRELDDTRTFHFDFSERPFFFAPGQFNMLYLFGAGEVAISISGDPSHPTKLAHTVRAVGQVTRPLCQLKRGQMIGLRGPYGVGWPLELARDKDVVVVAGGLGLAPLRPAILHILAQRALYRRVTILYGARTPGDLLYRADLTRWKSLLDVTLEVTVDRADSDWKGHVGVVTELVKQSTIDPAATVAMVCGPEVMMRFVARALQARGVSTDAMYLSLERNMKCAVGFCGHCQFGPAFVCKDGPVFRYDRVAGLLHTREL